MESDGRAAEPEHPAQDRAAFDRLFALAAPRLELFIRLRLGQKLRERLEPLDVLQETYVDALAARERYQHADEEGFVRWACCIAEHRIRGLADHWQAQKRRPRGAEVPVSQLCQQARASGTGPVTVAQRAETRERLALAVEALEEDERAAVLLRFFQGLDLESLARELGRSPTAVRRLLGRAMARLGIQLSGWREDDHGR
jgi:RNA polymerase sigma factor (sigma-70 family)